MLSSKPSIKQPVSLQSGQSSAHRSTKPYLLQLLHFRKIHRPRNVNLAFFNVIKDYKESYIYKFRDCEKYDGRRYYLDKNNLLTGSLGIYYAIDLYFGLEDHVGLLNLIM